MDNHCKNLRKKVFGEICSSVRNAEPIPPKFINHARNCAHCLFWLSYGLAIKSAMFNTFRIMKSEDDCPPKEDFRDLLMAVATGIKAGGLKTAAEAKDLLVIIGYNEGNEDLAIIWDHIQECELCGSYYSDLFDSIIVAQPDYEQKIRTGSDIRADFLDRSKEIYVTSVNYVSNLHLDIKI